MTFVFFLLLVWAVCTFHLREHRRLGTELARAKTLLPPREDGSLQDADWRVTAEEAQNITLKRRFHPQDRDGVLRYALPPVFFCLMLFVLKSWWMGALYAALMALRWFAMSIEMSKMPQENTYAAKIGRWKIFGGTF